MSLLAFINSLFSYLITGWVYSLIWIGGILVHGGGFSFKKIVGIRRDTKMFLEKLLGLGDFSLLCSLGCLLKEKRQSPG